MNAVEFYKHCKIEDGLLSVDAQSPDVGAEQAAAILEWAVNNESFHSLQLHGSTEYKEPYFWTVHPWIEGIIQSKVSCLRSFTIAHATTMNRQFGIHVGDITPILENNAELSKLYIIGSFECANYTHNALQQIHVANCFLNIDALRTLSRSSLPRLRSLAIYNGDAGFANTEFNTVLVESLHALKANQLSELYLCDWADCDDFLKKLVKMNILEQLELLHIDGFEFGYDPEETVDLLLSFSDVLGKLSSFRIPFKGLMEDEIAKLSLTIPGIVNSRPEGGKFLDPF